MAEQKKNVSESQDVGDEFNYLVRIASTDLDGHKKVELALTGITGLGRRLATLVADKAGVARKEKIGNLSDEDVAKLEKTIPEVIEEAPEWMLNRRNDYETGEDTHLVGSDVRLMLRDDVNRERKIRSYRGIRHETNRQVRGQRTRSNGRHGLTVGVTKKK